MFLYDQYYIYKKVSWGEIRDEYKSLLNNIRWKRVPSLLLTPSGDMFVYSIIELYESTERSYKLKLKNKEALKKLRGRLNGGNKH